MLQDGVTVVLTTHYLEEAETLTALASSNIAIFLVQVALVTAAISAVIDVPALTNPLPAVVGMLLGAVSSPSRPT